MPARTSAASTTTASQPTEITLVRAGEIRDANGRYVYGATKTLRKKIISGELPAEKKRGQWYIKVADLRSTPASPDDVLMELRAAAERAAAAAPPLAAEASKMIAGILNTSI
ncbi:hypothetical protein ACXR2T_09765 [Leucobacter sp. HY1910]